MRNEDTFKSLSIVQDFFSKRAVAHASFFVASMFGLFTILSFMERDVNRISLAWNWNLRLSLLSATYWFIWLFGFYSLGNFGYYATLAQHAEEKIAENKDNEIINESKKGLGRILKWFYDFKSGHRKEGLFGWVRKHNTIMFFLFYIVIGFFPFISIVFL